MRPRYRTAIVAVAALWISVILLFLAGRYTPFPMLPGVESGLVLGTVVGVALGFWTLFGRADNGPP